MGLNSVSVSVFRNYDNVFFVASCDFVSQSVNSAQAILSRVSCFIDLVYER